MLGLIFLIELPGSSLGHLHVSAWDVCAFRMRPVLVSECKFEYLHGRLLFEEQHRRAAVVTVLDHQFLFAFAKIRPFAIFIADAGLDLLELFRDGLLFLIHVCLLNTRGRS